MSDSTAQPQHAEPDTVAATSVLVWGVGALLFVLMAMLVVGSYFWMHRQEEDMVKVRESRQHRAAVIEGSLQAAGKLQGYRMLGEGVYQVPIERAMQLVVTDYQAKK